MYAVDNYKRSCNLILEELITHMGYEEPEHRWVSEDTAPPSVAIINDDFWNIEDMVLALMYKIPEDKMFEWYYETLERATEGKETQNLYSYHKN